MTTLSMSTGRVKFGDVAINSTTVSADPEAEGFDRYIIGKHIPGEADRIETWGPVGDSDFGPRIRTIFQPGDVICTTRGPKLKVARVDFRGLGAHTNFYLRTADPEVILQPYLEAVVRSNGFQQHLVNNFRGSVNLFVNWSDAAKYEFALPPLEEQRRMADLFQATTVYKDRLRELSKCSLSTSDSAIDLRMRGLTLGESNFHKRVGNYYADWDLIPIGDLITVAQYGLSESLDSSGRYPVLRMMNLEDGKATADDLKYLDLSDNDFDTYKLVDGDVLFNRTNSYELVGRTGVFGLSGDYVFASYLIRLKTQADLLLPEYLCAFLRAPIGRRQVMSFATRGVSQTNVNASNLKRILIPVPPLEYQKDLVSVLQSLESARSDSQDRLLAARRLASTVINGSMTS